MKLEYIEVPRNISKVKKNSNLSVGLGGDKRGRPLLFVCLKTSRDKEKAPKSEDFEAFGGDKRDRTAVVCLPESLSR